MNRTTTISTLILALTGCGGASFSAMGDDAGDGDAAPSRDSGSETGDAAGDVGDAQPDTANDAAPDGDASPPCITDLSGVGTGDFRIVFTVTTTGKNEALVNQRSVCSWVSAFWDVVVDMNGHIVASTGDGTQTGVIGLPSTVNVSDGVPHHVVASRIAGMLDLRVDAVVTPAVADSNALYTLPPLQQGTDICVGDVPGFVALVGTLSDLCITRP